MDLVKRILLDLHRSLQRCEDQGRKRLAFERLDPFDFVAMKQNPAFSPKSVSRHLQCEGYLLVLIAHAGVSQIRWTF